MTMTREEERDMACTNWICSQENGTVIKAREVWKAAVKWADQHPKWIPVEEELPLPYCSNGSISDFVQTYNGYDVVKGYYDFMKNNWHNENGKVMEFNVTHWMEIVPPRKEE